MNIMVTFRGLLHFLKVKMVKDSKSRRIHVAEHLETLFVTGGQSVESPDSGRGRIPSKAFYSRII
jgi:hypothetical protein